MEVIEWIMVAVQIIFGIVALLLWNKASNHYENKEYRQAIYHMLYVILLVLIMKW